MLTLYEKSRREWYYYLVLRRYKISTVMRHMNYLKWILNCHNIDWLDDHLSKRTDMLIRVAK